ncbi:MAG: DUF6356 family protein [Acetobacteraceae bacterium]
MKLSFTQHPRAVGESYPEHFGVAMGFAGAMIAGGLACAVHAVLPFCFTTTGSATIRRLHERMVVSRIRHAAPALTADPAVTTGEV